MSTEPADFSLAGVVEDGDFRTYLVDPTVDPVSYLSTPYIRRGSILRLVGNLTINKCDASNRQPIAIASMNWPDQKAAHVLSNFAKSTNIGDVKYDKLRTRFMSGQKEGEAWVLVAIPGSGTNVTITAGKKLVPSNEAGAGVVAYTDASTGSGAEILETLRIIGTALTNIHTELDAISGQPSLGLNNADTLAASTGEVLGWVLASIDI